MAPTSKVSQGIKKASRSHTYHRRGLWAIKAKHGGAFPKAVKTAAAAAAAAPKFYPADDVKPRQPSTRKPNATKLRSEQQPTTEPRSSSRLLRGFEYTDALGVQVVHHAW
ncbi:hypothetical protein GUJ93_ZPchr0006g43642 [Zizania palustris]|uniref:Ribosomal protein L6 N-terminal domain-containing protein n=1 Tax=Zizania palustris TaxID=103762 RepID=A0A8J5SIS4_ZIZPA|nr:hypothetical protein GUJ93_ZPchr0006g43642 [Zizania palustris]